MAEAYTATCQTCSKSTDLGFSYTARGEVATTYESTPNSGGYYNVGMTYWPNGMVNTMSSPSFPTFTYTPDPEGRPYAVFAMTGQNPVTSTLYNTAGQTTSVTYTSGDVDTFSFDSNTGRQNGYQFKMGSLFDTATLTWNANGSLWKLAITDQINSANTQNCTYLYDDLGRIGLPPGSTGKSVDCGATKWQQNFSFDAFGNITKAVPTGGTGLSFSPTYNTTTNRYQTLPGFTPVYDGNGNLKADGSHTYSWDAVNNPVQLDGVGVTYDALGRMVEINATTYRTQWVYSPTGEKVELMLNGQTFAGAWIPLPGGGKRLYHISNGTVDGYTRPDWLGSARLVTSDTQTLISDVAYAPYGEDYASPSPYLQFTSGSLGENTVSASGGQGLYDFDFRKYSPAQGRWISPDPAGMAAVELSNPQTWNRYAYVGNMPTGAVDPLGLWGSDVFGTARGGGVDPLLDPGGAWLNSQVQQFMADAGLLSPMQQGLYQYLNSIPGYSVAGNNLMLLRGSESHWDPDDRAVVQTLTWEDLGPLSGGGAANNGPSWTGVFLKSLLKGPSTGPGSCLGVFTDTVTAPLKQVQSAVKNYVPLIVGAMQAGPSGAAMYMQQLNNMVASGAAEADPQVAAVVTTAGAVAATAAPYASAAAPYAGAGGADLVLAYGLGAELKAGFNGQCRW